MAVAPKHRAMIVSHPADAIVRLPPIPCSFLRLRRAREQETHSARDLEVLARGHDDGARRGPGRPDLSIGGGARIRLLVERDAEEAESGRRAGADLRGVSPTPPVKTSASRPPSAATIAAMPARRRWM